MKEKNSVHKSACVPKASMIIIILATSFLVTLPLLKADSQGILQPHLITFPIAGSTQLSDGTVLVIKLDWATDTDQIWKSVDKGVSWIYVSTLPDSFALSCEKLYCTDKDTVLAVDGGLGHQGYIYRSADKGLTWVESYRFDSTTEGCSFDIYEDGNGRVYVPVYSFDGTLNHAKLLRSTNDGVSWQQIANWQGYRHCHDVFVNTYNGYIYVALGDYSDALMRSKDNGVTWTNLDTAHLWASINSKGDSNTVYLGEDDTYSRICRFTDDGSSSFNLQTLYDYGNSSAGGYWFLQPVNGKLVFGTTVDAAGKHVLLGVSDAAWNSFSVVQDIVANGAWQGFWPATMSYWPLTKIYVAYTCSYGSAYEPSSTTFALSITSTSGGTTSPSPGTYVYASGYQVQVTANASSNYLFAYWELDGLNVGTANPHNITMSQAHTLNAVFTPTFALSITSTSGGTTSPNPGTYVYASGYQVQVTANASSNYLFAYWELDGLNVGTANPHNITMSQAHTLNAVFTLKPAVPLVYFAPEGIQIIQGVSFSIDVDVVKVTDLYAFDVRVHFIPNLLQVCNVTEGFFLQSGGTTQVFLEEVNQTEGYLRYIVTLETVETGVNGSGTLFTVTLTSDQGNNGTSTLLLQGTNMSDSQANLILYDSKDGNVTVTGHALTEVTQTVTVGQTEYTILMVSNSSIPAGNQFLFDNSNKIISMNLTGPSGYFGFCNITIPKPVMNGIFAVLVNGTAVAYTQTENATHYMICFTYSQSLEEIKVQQTVLGDINGDRKVNVVDLAMVAKAYGTASGDPRWDARCDLNKDNRIDLSDLVVVARNFGYLYNPN